MRSTDWASVNEAGKWAVMCKHELVCVCVRARVVIQNWGSKGNLSSVSQRRLWRGGREVRLRWGCALMDLALAGGASWAGSKSSHLLCGRREPDH